MSVAGTAKGADPGPKASRLQDNLNTMAAIGAQPNGSVCRRAFSQEDQQSRELLASWMAKAGMGVRVDAAGNLIGRLDGREAHSPVLMMGSHLDTVPNGGRFDGVLGVLAGLEVVRCLREQGRQLHHPVELVVFADEESTMVGSKAIAGTALLDPDQYTTNNGQAIEVNLKRIGGDFSALTTARREDAEIAAYLELHVEQGGVLERRDDVIGVVEGVVGIRRFTVTIEGEANHAGTTPMCGRRDALVAASQVVLAVNGLSRNHPSQPVATVGKLDVWPNAANVVPGQVVMSVAMRDLNPSVLDLLCRELEGELEAIRANTGCTVQLTPQFSVDPTPADPLLSSTIREVAADLGLRHSDLPSRASHDAQEMGRRWPMGMIFVPSRGGLSHTPAEFTSSDDCAAGTAVLLETLQRLDRRL